MHDFTLLITAYERRDTLPFLLSSLRESNLKVVVADSSTTPYENKYRYPWVEFWDFPNKNIYQVLYESSLRANTKYICWNNDDDLIFVDAVKRCLDFAKANPTYSNVLGYQSKIDCDYGYPEYCRWRDNSLPQKDFFERLSSMFDCFTTPVHAVIKTEVMIESCRLVLNTPELYPIRFFDRIFGIISATYGKKKVLPIHYMLRSNDRLINKAEYPEILKRHVKQSEIIKTLKHHDPISKFIARHLNLSYQACHSYLIETLMKYFAKV